MCGRAAQTRHAHYAAARLSLGLSAQPEETMRDEDRGGGDDNDGPSKTADSSTEGFSGYPWRDNFNMSPGMDAMIFYKDEIGSIRSVKCVWGLVNKRGTTNNPLPRGMGKHFEGLMFNARSDTLYQKPSFGRLASMGRSCLVALDGFFEWKAPGVAGKGKKQPYFVRRAAPKNSTDEKTKPYLLMAGLWNQVETGWDESPTLNTFTIITTESCQPLSWLHSRMPVCVWDDALARQWLENPNERVFNLLDQGARQTPEGSLDWYEVTTEMSSTKFRSVDAIKALPKAKSLKDFFAAASTVKASPKVKAMPKDNPRSPKTPLRNKADPKRKSMNDSPHATAKSNGGSAKRLKTPKRGTIDAFFTPKKQKS